MRTREEFDEVSKRVIATVAESVPNDIHVVVMLKDTKSSLVGMASSINDGYAVTQLLTSALAAIELASPGDGKRGAS